MKKITSTLLVMLLVGCGGEGTPADEVTQSEIAIESVPEPMDEASVEEPTEGDAIEGGGEGVALPSWAVGDPAAVFTCTSPEVDGVVYTIPLPVDQTHPAIVQMEQLRAEVGVKEVPHYVVVEIDASKAGPDVQFAGLYQASWATAEFETVDTGSIDDLISEWRDSIDIDDGDVDLYNRTVDVGNDLLNTVPNRGAKGFGLLVAEAPLESVVAPMIQTDGFTIIPCDLV